ncbi:MAG: glycosyltransferase family 39 protein [Acidobacteriota bacterium]|nr:glycosyltransferase family 39 protein [Acidobacteriota bacterium]
MSGNPTRRVRVSVAIGLAVVLLAAIWFMARNADNADRVLQVEVSCRGEQCRGSVNGGDPLTFSVSGGPDGDRVGLYAFEDSEAAPDPFFRHLELKDAKRTILRRDLTRRSEIRQFEHDAGWSVRPGRGLTHRGPNRKSSVALLGQAVPTDFDMTFQFEDTVDAGIMFRARDTDNGWLFIVRPPYNDAFFCAMRDGKPGRVEAIMPLRTMTTAREGLRLAGLVAEIVLVGGLLLLIFRFLAQVFPTTLPLSPIALRWIAKPNAPRALLATLFVLTLLGGAWISATGLGSVPHVNDEAAYLFQAKIFAEGKLAADVPADAEFFAHEHVLQSEGRWFSKYPPLFSLLMVPWVWIGVPWMTNPLLAALTGFLIFKITQLLTDWRWGVVAWLLALTSPFFMMMAGSMMAHMTAAFLITASIYFTLRGLRDDETRWAILAGLCLGAAILARPYTALLAVSAPLFLIATHAIHRDQLRAGLRFALTVALCVVPFVAAYLGWNQLNAPPESSGLNLYTAYHANDIVGFGPDKGSGWWVSWGDWGHTPAKGLRSVTRFVENSSHHFLGWPGRFSLGLIVAAFFWGRRRAVFWGFIALTAALMIGHWAYWAAFHTGYGARYWFSAAPVLLVLSAIGLREALDLRCVPSDVLPQRVATGHLLGIALVGLFIASNFSNYFPTQIRELAEYGGVTNLLKREMREREIDRSLVFVWTEGVIYNEGFFLNDPFMKDGSIFAIDLGERNAELLRRYPDRPAYRWTRGRQLIPLRGVPGSPAVAESRPDTMDLH